jgi:hypothetical protein
MANKFIIPDWVTQETLKEMKRASVTGEKLMRLFNGPDWKPPTPEELAVLAEKHKAWEAEHRDQLLGTVCGVEWTGGNLALSYSDGRLVTVYGCGYEADGVDWTKA